MKKVVKGRNHKKKVRRQGYAFRGIGMMSIVFVIGVLAALLGGVFFLPRSTPPATDDKYIIVPAGTCDEGDSLKLCTFNIATVTPTPKPTSPPVTRPPESSDPDPLNVKPTGGGSNNGSSKPTPGGGDNGGGNGGGGSEPGPL